MFQRTLAWQKSQVESIFNRAVERITERLAGGAA